MVDVVIPPLGHGTFPCEWRHMCSRGSSPSLLLLGHLGEHLLRYRHALKPGLLETTQPLTSQAYTLPCRPILRISIASIFHYPWDPLCQRASGRNEGRCVGNPCVPNNEEHWERMHPHLDTLPALIWGRRIRTKRGRAKGDIWLLEPLAPISMYQVKIPASS